MESTMNRRSFVKAAGGAALGAAMLAQAASFVKVAGADEPEATEEDIKVDETVDCDVVVVGAGMAGLCASIAGAEKGLNVVLLEKLGYTGGTSATAEGMFGCHSRLQLELGYDDDTDVYFQGIEDYDHWTNNPRICRRWLEHAGEAIDWVMDHGVEFKEVAATWSTVPSWHKYSVRGAHTEALGKAAEEAGVNIYLATPAKKLLVDDNGDACGVVAQDGDGKGYQFNAKAVVLCSGGYPCNKEMIETYTGWHYYEDEDESLGYTSWKGTPGRNGDGILMGLGAGADKFRLGAVMADYSEVAGKRVEEAHPIRCLVGIVPTLWVNEKAKRFTNEGLIDSFVSYGESRATQIESYNILDMDFLNQQAQGIICDCSGDAPKGTVFPDAVATVDAAVEGDEFMVWKADTIEELAEQMGLDPVALKDTVDHYNELCDAGYDSDFMKDPQYLIPVKTAPFYGVKTIPIFMTTVGGLRVDECMRVLRPDGSAIKGLYACGSDAGGLYGYEYDVLVAAGSQQSFAAVGGIFAIDDIVDNVLGNGDGYTPAGEDLAYSDIMGETGETGETADTADATAPADEGADTETGPDAE